MTDDDCLSFVNFNSLHTPVILIVGLTQQNNAVQTFSRKSENYLLHSPASQSTKGHINDDDDGGGDYGEDKAEIATRLVASVARLPLLGGVHFQHTNPLLQLSALKMLKCWTLFFNISY